MTFQDEFQAMGFHNHPSAGDEFADMGLVPNEHSSPLFRVLRGVMPDEQMLSLLRRSDYDNRG